MDGILCNKVIIGSRRVSPIDFCLSVSLGKIFHVGILWLEIDRMQRLSQHWLFSAKTDGKQVQKFDLVRIDYDLEPLRNLEGSKQGLRIERPQLMKSGLWIGEVCFLVAEHLLLDCEKWFSQFLRTGRKKDFDHLLAGGNETWGEQQNLKMTGTQVFGIFFSSIVLKSLSDIWNSNLPGLGLSHLQLPAIPVSLLTSWTWFDDRSNWNALKSQAWWSTSHIMWHVQEGGGGSFNVLVSCLEWVGTQWVGSFTNGLVRAQTKQHLQTHSHRMK